jgi:hypothetical protein
VAEYRAIEAATATAAQANLTMFVDDCPAIRNPPRHGKHDGPHYPPTKKERSVPKKSKMPGLVKVAEKRDQARIARLTASVSSNWRETLAFPLVEDGARSNAPSILPG